ncbi:hypothetical protein [Bradyrhizobium diazoefficiens]|uniref:hypothetical protein n=1 Tax=Bradyrhizobium diazoefficiens TaxID=1355477 RepID=UPI00057631A0|nr:hypothetical protein [Bradyrhizobium diazoefficiens]
MGIFRNSVALCLGFALTLSPGLAAERVLLDPDWNSPDVAKAQKALEAQRAANASPDVRRDAELPLTLPRWGLSGRIDQPTSDEQSRARSGQLTGSIPAWPSCAKPAADPKPVTDGSGLWYTDTYDYGCVVISISGDRSAKPDQDFPTDARPPDECSDQSSLDSTETDTRGRFDMQLSLNRIPYEIVGRCTEEAETFCRNRAARCALAGRLILRGGSPQ